MEHVHAAPVSGIVTKTFRRGRRPDRVSTGLILAAIEAEADTAA